MLLVHINVRGVINMPTKKAARKARMKSFVKVIIVVAIVAAVAVGLYFATPKAVPAPPKTEVSLTEAPDYNACNVIKIDTIKNTFYANLITGISQGVRAGVKAPNDTIADSCGFGLTTEKSLNNSLSVQVYPYTATVSGASKEAADASWSEVAGSKPIAYFGKDVNDQTIIYKLRVIPGGKNVMFELRQPIDAAAIDEPSALDFLVGLAAKADFSVIDLQATKL